MSKLKVNSLAKSFGIHELFREVSFEVAKGDKVGFVGANGTGKTTLLKVFMGEEEADGGSVSLDSAATVGYARQQNSFGAGTLHDEFRRAFADIEALAERKRQLEESIAEADEAKLAAYGRVVERFEDMGGYDYESRLRRVAFGLGFTEDDLEKDVRHFSGGQQTRINLAKALIREPDFLLLDEPTNHLDINMIEWLEKFLVDYKGGVLLVSHDRFFLDRVTSRIIELEGGRVTVYEGNYTYFQKVKQERKAALAAAYAKQQAYIKKTEEYIRRYKAGIKAKQARGRQSQLGRLERIVLPPEAASFNYFAFHAPPECAQRVAELEDVSFAYGAHELFAHLSLLIRRGDGVALVGANGTGKTTLLRLLIGELNSSTGRVKIGSRVKIGYFSQQHEGLHKENTLLDELIGEYGLTEGEARSYLGAFLFHGDEVFRLIGELSGGEQSRLAFLKLMLTGANFLVLDEPTNHLDIPAKEAVEEALMAFPGTFLVVSHDRYFLDKVTNSTLELAGGHLTEYRGNYSYYREQKDMAAKQAAKVAMPPHKAKSHEAAKQPSLAAKGQLPTAKAPTKNISASKKDDMLLKAEAQIALAEAELKMLEAEMNQPENQADIAKSQAIAGEYAAKEAEIQALYEHWANLADA